MKHYFCECERGGDCTKTTMCHVQSAIEEGREEIEGLKVSITDAIAMLDNDLYKHRVRSARNCLRDALDCYGWLDE